MNSHNDDRRDCDNNNCSSNNNKMAVYPKVNITTVGTPTYHSVAPSCHFTSVSHISSQ
jgi:hypothetical protein